MILRNYKTKLWEYVLILNWFLRIGLKNILIWLKGFHLRLWIRFIRIYMRRLGMKILILIYWSILYYRYHRLIILRKMGRKGKEIRISLRRFSLGKYCRGNSLSSWLRLKIILFLIKILYFRHQDCTKWGELAWMSARHPISRCLELHRKVASEEPSSETLYSTVVLY